MTYPRVRAYLQKGLSAIALPTRHVDKVSNGYKMAGLAPRMGRRCLGELPTENCGTEVLPGTQHTMDQQQARRAPRPERSKWGRSRNSIQILVS